MAANQKTNLVTSPKDKPSVGGCALAALIGVNDQIFPKDSTINCQALSNTPPKFESVNVAIEANTAEVFPALAIPGDVDAMNGKGTAAFMNAFCIGWLAF